MRDPRTLGPWLRRFLADYVVTERRLADNTQKSYRDSFKRHLSALRSAYLLTDWMSSISHRHACCSSLLISRKIGVVQCRRATNA